jgi:hypothetical protein
MMDVLSALAAQALQYRSPITPRPAWTAPSEPLFTQIDPLADVAENRGRSAVPRHLPPISVGRSSAHSPDLDPSLRTADSPAPPAATPSAPGATRRRRADAAAPGRLPRARTTTSETVSGVDGDGGEEGLPTADADATGASRTAASSPRISKPGHGAEARHESEVGILNAGAQPEGKSTTETARPRTTVQKARQRRVSTARAADAPLSTDAQPAVLSPAAMRPSTAIAAPLVPSTDAWGETARTAAAGAPRRASPTAPSDRYQVATSDQRQTTSSDQHPAASSDERRDVLPEQRLAVESDPRREVLPEQRLAVASDPLRAADPTSVAGRAVVALAARPAPVPGAGGDHLRHSHEEPAIHISIDRIDVRPDPQATAPLARPGARALPLRTYLERRGRGGP